MKKVAEQQIPEADWNAVLDNLTRQFQGAHARVEVLGPGANYRVETEDRPFAGISADIKAGQHVVWIDLGEVSHAIHDATVVRVLPRVGNAGPVVEVESGDGLKTILTLESPSRHALPDAA
jgi:hypothetical protein